MSYFVDQIKLLLFLLINRTASFLYEKQYGFAIGESYKTMKDHSVLMLIGKKYLEVK